MTEITPNDSKNPQQTVQSDSQTQALPHGAHPQVESEQQAPAQAPVQDSAQPVPSQPQSYVQPHSYVATSPVMSTASQQPTNQQMQPQQPYVTQSGTQQPVNPAQNPFAPNNPQTAQSPQPFQSSDGLLHPQNVSQQTTTSPLPGKSAIRTLGKKTWGIIVGISLLCGLIGGAVSAGIVTALTVNDHDGPGNNMQMPGGNSGNSQQRGGMGQPPSGGFGGSNGGQNGNGMSGSDTNSGSSDSDSGSANSSGYTDTSESSLI
ncbi:hypothetical protein [Bifidobacterium tissieri]|uniref:Ethanolamine utilization protein EutL n=1 Tax=Bifidobacterium tissieri TaxID=1630162 RepID=A0A5M9ZSG0_9BIFI|nr:hypothetical protein [Bifidobacterium tissieri]KAA8830389.1 hypothetical protein EMO89_05195 [Bifidobacterium tissieri]KAA8832570.1 hypothetical protein EM849_03420 [Bifidobacterium tissieri]